MNRRVVILGSGGGATLVAAIARVLAEHDVCVVTGDEVRAMAPESYPQLGTFTIMDDARDVRNHQPSYRVNFKSGKPLRY